MRLAVASALTLWVGATLVLSRLRWFRQPSLVDRLAPYAPHGPGADRSGVLSVASFRDVVAPLAARAGERIAAAFGVGEDVATRLARVHADEDATAFRMRQFGWAGTGLGAGTLVAAAAGPPVAVSFLLVLGSPLLAFLVVEQQLSARSARRQHRVFLELPVVAEQLAMLLGAGYSLGAALTRVAGRGHGACAEDLALVLGRIRQGLTERAALREWAARSSVPALDRLVAVLALDHEATDLGRLVSEEAKAIRRDLHREQLVVLERRQQQVWIPVTVATLVPGVIFLAIPFIEALNLFSNS